MRTFRLLLRGFVYSCPQHRLMPGRRPRLRAGAFGWAVNDSCLRLCWFVSMLVVCLHGDALSEDDVPNRPVEVLQLDEFSEGPVFDYEGNLFVTHGRRFVTKLTPGGEASLWATVDGPNGHKVLPDGTHLLCVKGAVLRMSADGRLIEKASSECNGVPLRAPNDLTLDDVGGFYFTDPGGSRERPIGTVHYVDANGRTHLAAGGMSVPNGLVLSPDRKRLYVAETVPNRVVWFDVTRPGQLGPLNVLANLPHKDGVDGPDGLAVDTRGNVYVAHLGMTAVQVISPAGTFLRSLPAGNYDASNLVFGGPEQNQLYVTGSVGRRFMSPGRVFRLELSGVRGVSSLLPRQEIRPADGDVGGKD